MVDELEDMRRRRLGETGAVVRYDDGEWAQWQGECRGCGALLRADEVFCDLGAQPLANSLLTDLRYAEVHYPLRVTVCRYCALVQLPYEHNDQIFTASYPFFSGQSKTWVSHCEEFATKVVGYETGAIQNVLELGSNDGTMLAAFQKYDVPVLGVEPCHSVAWHAMLAGIPTIEEFWSLSTRKKLGDYKADLIIINNTLAHAEDQFDFLCAVREVLAPGGMVSIETPYLGDMLQTSQWDQIYAEHHCYFSVASLSAMLHRAGLWMYDVEWLPLHGGSIHVWAGCDSSLPRSKPMIAMQEKELEVGISDGKKLAASWFKDEPAHDKRSVWQRLVVASAGAPSSVPRIFGYGASAKAAVILNYYGWGPEIIERVVDTTPAKQGHYIPGVRIPIVAPSVKPIPDIVVNFLHNWREESESNIKALWPNATIFYPRGREDD
jgi:hypothetical protein